ncbi:phosphopantetheine-binding protein [Streptomyces sp. NPDC001401]|uniref:phosphopantetheine-binding protein n=1 Tax=Streptomyces sp. NPDC001401 TaxID=3364570 RepID=UPI0036BCF3CF
MTQRTWPDRFEDIVRRHIPLLPSSDGLRPDAALSDLGLDSLGIVSLILDLEDAFDFTIPDESFVARTFSTPAMLWAELSPIICKEDGHREE